LGERKVRIITAEIINQMNQSEDQNSQFDKVWELTLDKIELNNRKILDIGSPAICNFIENRVLLNCPVFCRSSDFYTDEYSFIIGMPQKEIVFISYLLNDDLKIESFTGPGFQQDAPAVWLYDEFHHIDNGFEHHIIFSDGISYIVPFEKFYCRSTKWFEEV
jgi:hypothetical protein